MDFSEEMDAQMNSINERDLFNYIFFNQLLTQKKKEFLEKNTDRYGQLRFYKNLKNNLLQNINENIKEKLADRISAYKKSPQIINLFPIDINIESRPQEMPVFAAASAIEGPKVTAKSFIDEDKTFVVRLIKMDNKTKIYPFNLKDTKPQKIKITLYPTEDTYTIDSDKHLELEGVGEIESVSVEAVS